jgi:hypothetical protein
MGKGNDTGRPNHPNGHCYHQLAPVFGLQLGGAPPVPAIPEVCCWCPGTRLTVVTSDRPAEADKHGPSLRFMEPPKPEPAPVRLLVPNGPRIVH